MLSKKTQCKSWAKSLRESACLRGCSMSCSAVREMLMFLLTCIKCFTPVADTYVNSLEIVFQAARNSDIPIFSVTYLNIVKCTEQGNMPSSSSGPDIWSCHHEEVCRGWEDVNTAVLKSLSICLNQLTYQLFSLSVMFRCISTFSKQPSHTTFVFYKWWFRTYSKTCLSVSSIDLSIHSFKLKKKYIPPSDLKPTVL